MKPNECIPGCGQCCGGATPARPEEVTAILDYLKRFGKKSEKQLRWWGGNPEICPFLTKDKSCYVYPVRPSVCRAFGHIQFQGEKKAVAELIGLVDLSCPRQLTGETFFDPWSDEQIAKFDNEQRVTDPATKVVILAMFGREVMHALKTGVLEVTCFTSGEWAKMLAEARGRSCTSTATTSAASAGARSSPMG